MLITEWQEKFLQLVTEGKYNVFPPAMIKALLAEEADYTKWTNRNFASDVKRDYGLTGVSGITSSTELRCGITSSL